MLNVVIWFSLNVFVEIEQTQWSVDGFEKSNRLTTTISTAGELMVLLPQDHIIIIID